MQSNTAREPWTLLLWPGYATASQISSSAWYKPRRAAAELAHRAKYLRINTGFMSRLFALRLELVDRVDREMSG
jgi:hypothetical protein